MPPTLSHASRSASMLSPLNKLMSSFCRLVLIRGNGKGCAPPPAPSTPAALVPGHLRREDELQGVREFCYLCNILYLRYNSQVGTLQIFLGNLVIHLSGVCKHYLMDVFNAIFLLLGFSLGQCIGVGSFPGAAYTHYHAAKGRGNHAFSV